MPGVLPKWPPAAVLEYIGRSKSRSLAIDFGVKSNTSFTFAVSSESESEEVPNDSARTLTGFATPIT